MVFVRRGSAVAYVDDIAYHLQEGSFFLAFPNQTHRYVESHNGEYVLLIVKSAGRDSLFHGRPISSVCEKADEHTVILLEMALSEYEKGGYTPVVAACLSAFWEKLLTFYQIEDERLSGNTGLRILQYCHEHYREDITVGHIAEALHISNSTVSHSFRKRLGVSFSEYIHSLRLGDAAHLLKNSHYSITEIAELAGFSTIRTFNRAFRVKYGMSPSEYRKKAVL